MWTKKITRSLYKLIILYLVLSFCLNLFYHLGKILDELNKHDNLKCAEETKLPNESKNFSLVQSMSPPQYSKVAFNEQM